MSAGVDSFWAPDGPAMSHERSDWNTPEEVLTVVRRFAGEDGIGLDPCSNLSSIVGAKECFSLENGKDGLSLSWDSPVGVIYVNPPYGREIARWVVKAGLEAETAIDLVMLVPSRTDSGWFHLALNSADAVCFWSGRLKFLGAPSTAPFPSTVFYWGDSRYRFADVFEGVGRVVLL